MFSTVVDKRVVANDSSTHRSACREDTWGRDAFSPRALIKNDVGGVGTDGRITKNLLGHIEQSRVRREVRGNGETICKGGLLIYGISAYVRSGPSKVIQQLNLSGVHTTAEWSKD